MFLLDTNVVSELRRASSGRANPNVVGWARSVTAGDTHVSAITIMELEIGILRLARRDPNQHRRLRRWLETDVIGAFAGRILPIDLAVARRCAALHVPDPMSERDAYIAATALTHGLDVVTHNTRDFIRSGVRLLNPWEDLAAP